MSVQGSPGGEALRMKIENRVAENSAQDRYQGILLGATKLFAASFFLSSLIKF